MSVKEITELIMRPGFSTAAQVTRTSGRGVGMDVVKKNLENLNGTIEIDSQFGKGTSIRIKIPLTVRTSYSIHYTKLYEPRVL